MNTRLLLKNKLKIIFIYCKIPRIKVQGMIYKSYKIYIMYMPKNMIFYLIIFILIVLTILAFQAL